MINACQTNQLFSQRWICEASSTARSLSVKLPRSTGRGLAIEEWYLSPYEFTSEWEVVMSSYPQSLSDADNPTHHAELTPDGKAKLRDHPRRAPDLRPRIDYVVKDAGGQGWMLFPKVPSTEYVRHTWIIEKKASSIRSNVYRRTCSLKHRQVCGTCCDVDNGVFSSMDSTQERRRRQVRTSHWKLAPQRYLLARRIDAVVGRRNTFARVRTLH